MELKHWIMIGSIVSVLMASVVLFVPKVGEIANDLTKEFRDYKPPSSEVVDFVLDNTDGSTGTKENLSAMLDLWLPWIAEATGSSLRIICQGQQGTTATIVFETQSKAPAQNTEKARRAYVLRFTHVLRFYVFLHCRKGQSTTKFAPHLHRICTASFKQIINGSADTPPDSHALDF